MRCPPLTAVLLCLSVSVVHAASERPSAANPVVTCTQQLKQIGRALAAYEREQGALPPHVSDLVPRYLRDRKLLHCPSDPSTGAPEFQGAAVEPGLACSYSYEMNTDATSVRCFQLGPRPTSMTFRSQKLAQRVHFGDRVPVLRCGHHSESGEGRARPFFLNLTRSGQVYRSQMRWEFDPETLPAVLTCLERDLGEGAETFRNRWRANRLAEYLSAVPPAPSCREQCRKVAGKLATLAFSSPYTAAYSICHAVEGLYRVSGDEKGARLWRRRWTGGLLAPISTT